jgi:hypothetical protein
VFFVCGPRVIGVADAADGTASKQVITELHGVRTELCGGNPVVVGHPRVTPPAVSRNEPVIRWIG